MDECGILHDGYFPHDLQLSAHLQSLEAMAARKVHGDGNNCNGDGKRESRRRSVNTVPHSKGYLELDAG